MYEIKVTGITCGGCVNSVTNALKTLDAKADVSVDLASQTVRVKSEKTQTEINATIEDAGYSIVDSKIIN